MPSPSSVIVTWLLSIWIVTFCASASHELATVSESTAGIEEYRLRPRWSRTLRLIFIVYARSLIGLLRY